MSDGDQLSTTLFRWLQTIFTVNKFLFQPGVRRFSPPFRTKSSKNRPQGGFGENIAFVSSARRALTGASDAQKPRHLRQPFRWDYLFSDYCETIKSGKIHGLLSDFPHKPAVHHQMDHMVHHTDHQGQALPGEEGNLQYDRKRQGFLPPHEDHALPPSLSEEKHAPLYIAGTSWYLFSG